MSIHSYLCWFRSDKVVRQSFTRNDCKAQHLRSCKVEPASLVGTIFSTDLEYSSRYNDASNGTPNPLVCRHFPERLEHGLCIFVCCALSNLRSSNGISIKKRSRVNSFLSRRISAQINIKIVKLVIATDGAILNLECVFSDAIVPTRSL